VDNHPCAAAELFTEVKHGIDFRQSEAIFSTHTPPLIFREAIGYKLGKYVFVSEERETFIIRVE
jgi:hypothetical protein